LVAALASGLAGCSSGEDATVVTATTAASSDAPQTSLTIVIDPGDGAQSEEWTLACDPAGGTHPDPEAACAALAGVEVEAFMPVAADQMCTQIYGGPETATVRGTWRADRVDASFSRQHGCEIARWDAVAALLN
jgi:hypothetical protein